MLKSDVKAIENNWKHGEYGDILRFCAVKSNCHDGAEKIALNDIIFSVGLKVDGKKGAEPHFKSAVKVLKKFTKAPVRV